PVSIAAPHAGSRAARDTRRPRPLGYHRPMRKVLGVLVLLVIVAATAWFLAGRASGPAITVEAPGPLVGQRSPLRLVVHAPDADLASLAVRLEQGGEQHLLGDLSGAGTLEIAREGDALRVTGELGRQQVPALSQGAATLVVEASRPVLFGLRTVASEVRHDVDVRLTPPSLAPLSQFHFINQG